MTEPTAHLGITRPRRRLRRAAAAGAGLLLAAVVPGLARGADDSSFVTGSGYSSAQILRVGPTAARLSLAPSFGLTLADYIGTVGRGQSTVADWAAIGVAEDQLPKNTPTLRITSEDKNAAKGITKCYAGSFGDGPCTGPGVLELGVRATKQPFGESRFRMASFTVPGLVEMGNSVSRTTSGIVASGVRESTSEVDISSLDFAAGVVHLSGLSWVASQRTGNGGTKLVASFTVQGASIGGIPMSLPVGGSDIETILGPLSAALAPTGFAIRPPGVDDSGGVARVTPLAFEIVNSPLGRQFVAPLLASAQKYRDPLSAAFIDLAKQLYEGSNHQVPDLTVGVLAGDLALGIVSGSSELHIEFGGTNAYTEGQRYVNPFGNLPDLAPIAGAATVNKIVVPGTAGRPGTPGSGPYDTGLLTAAAPPGIAGRNVPGSRGGAAIAVGLIGLAVAAGLAAADWARMRAARRTTEN